MPSNCFHRKGTDGKPGENSCQVDESLREISTSEKVAFKELKKKKKPVICGVAEVPPGQAQREEGTEDGHVMLSGKER